MATEKTRIIPGKSYASKEEIVAYKHLCKMLKECPIPPSEILANLALFLPRASLSRILFMHNLYRNIINVHGIIVEFGVRWGHNLALFTAFRAIYEPYNCSRKIIGFDTFEGFPSISSYDGTSETAFAGALSVTPQYEDYLEELLATHEELAPRSHIRKFELVKGNVLETLPQYLADHPETIIALAYFDLDLYEPTKKCLELIKDHLAKGSVVGFDNLTLDEFPGETLAFKEEWGINNYRIHRDPTVSYESFISIE